MKNPQLAQSVLGALRVRCWFSQASVSLASSLESSGLGTARRNVLGLSFTSQAGFFPTSLSFEPAPEVADPCSPAACTHTPAPRISNAPGAGPHSGSGEARTQEDVSPEGTTTQRSVFIPRLSAFVRMHQIKTVTAEQSG